MDLPNPEYIKNLYAFFQIPYYLVNDDALSLQQWVIRPYPGQRIQGNYAFFNYWSSTACKVIENAFGILAIYW